MRLQMSVKGCDQVAEALERIRESLIPAMAQGVDDAVTMVANSARECVPTDTGALRDSIQTTVHAQGDTVVGRVSATAEHAAFVELGTKDQPARPFLAPAFRENEGAIPGCIARAIQKGVSG